MTSVLLLKGEVFGETEGKGRRDFDHTSELHHDLQCQGFEPGVVLGTGDVVAMAFTMRGACVGSLMGVCFGGFGPYGTIKLLVGRVPGSAYGYGGA